MLLNSRGEDLLHRPIERHGDPHHAVRAVIRPKGHRELSRVGDTQRHGDTHKRIKRDGDPLAVRAYDGGFEVALKEVGNARVVAQPMAPPHLRRDIRIRLSLLCLVILYVRLLLDPIHILMELIENIIAQLLRILLAIPGKLRREPPKNVLKVARRDDRRAIAPHELQQRGKGLREQALRA